MVEFAYNNSFLFYDIINSGNDTNTRKAVDFKDSSPLSQGQKTQRRKYPQIILPSHPILFNPSLEQKESINRSSQPLILFTFTGELATSVITGARLSLNSYQMPRKKKQLSSDSNKDGNVIFSYPRLNRLNAKACYLVNLYPKQSFTIASHPPPVRTARR